MEAVNSKQIDMQTVYETTAAIGRHYVFFALVLIVVNSLVKFFLDKQNKNETHQIVAVCSAVLVVIFWYFGVGFWKLVLVTFATFGFFDFVGRYAEKYLLWTVVKVVFVIQYLFAQLKKAVIFIMIVLKLQKKYKDN